MELDEMAVIIIQTWLNLKSYWFLHIPCLHISGCPNPNPYETSVFLCPDPEASSPTAGGCRGSSGSATPNHDRTPHR